MRPTGSDNEHTLWFRSTALAPHQVSNYKGVGPISIFKDAGTILSPSLPIGKASASENNAIASEWESYSMIRVADQMRSVPSSASPQARDS